MVQGWYAPALERAQEMPPIDRAPPKRRGLRLDENAFERYEAIRKLRAQRSRDEGIESSLLLRRELMEELAQAFPRSREELSEHLTPWQMERYGDALLGAMAQAPTKVR